MKWITAGLEERKVKQKPSDLGESDKKLLK